MNTIVHSGQRFRCAGLGKDRHMSNALCRESDV